MKRIIVIISLIFISNLCYSQEALEIPVVIKKTAPFESKTQKMVTINLVSAQFTVEDNEGGIFLGQRNKKAFNIKHFDKDLKLLKEYDYLLPKRATFLSAMLFNNKLCLIEAYVNRSAGLVDYYAHTASKEALSFTKQLLYSVNIKDFYSGGTVSFFGIGTGFSSLDSDYGGQFKASQNQKYLFTTVDINSAANEKRIIYAFDKDLKLSYKTELNVAIKDRKFSLQDAEIDEQDGSVYLLGKLSTKEAKKKKEGGNYEFVLYKVNGESTETLSFDSQDKYVAELKIRFNRGKLFGIGFYSDRNDNRYKGIAYINFDKVKMSLTNATYSPFTDQFLVDKYGQKKEKELKNIVLREIHIDENGNSIINAEEFFTKTNNSPNAISQRTAYYYRDIICTKLDANGTLIWARNINKKQAAGGKIFGLSYKTAFANNKTYFLFNSSDNLNRLRNDRIEFKGGKMKNSSFYIVSLDNDGQFQFKKLLDENEIDLDILVQMAATSTDRKSVIFIAAKKDKRQLLKVSIK